jgi:hypothetical protein
MAILSALKLGSSPPALAGAAPPATSTPARSSVHFHLANAGAAALVAASLLSADPAVAFIVRRLLTLPCFVSAVLPSSCEIGVLTARAWRGCREEARTGSR